MHILVDRWVTTSPFLRTVRRFHQWEKSASNQVSKTWSSLHLKVSENAFLAPPAGEKRYILFWTKLTRVHVVQNTRFSPTTPSVQISRRLVLLTQSACWPSHIRGPIRAQSCRNWAQRKQTLRINRRCPDASVTRVQTATRTETVPPPPDVVFFSTSVLIPEWREDAALPAINYSSTFTVWDVESSRTCLSFLLLSLNVFFWVKTKAPTVGRPHHIWCLVTNRQWSTWTSAQRWCPEKFNLDFLQKWCDPSHIIESHNQMTVSLTQPCRTTG